MQLTEIVTIEVGSAIATFILQLWLKDIVQRHYYPVLREYFQQEATQRGLPRSLPGFSVGKRSGSVGEGNSFVRRGGGSCTEEYTLLEELYVIPPLLGLSYIAIFGTNLS